MKFFLILFIFNSTIYAISTDIINTLAKDQTWLNLLHYDKNKQKSTILNKDFFLTKEALLNPRSELKKTLLAYEKDMLDEKHALCRFPSRYYWISQYIPLKDYKLKRKKCTSLYSWKRRHKADTLSVVFVSGFLGNPASAFGHSFIKINQKEKNSNHLFDTTISYGAKLPEKYTMLSYIYNGLTGGYNATYSDKYYYMDDIAYSHQEFREMWEYKLYLTKSEIDFLLLHLWELRNQEFKYYFFNRNCGYKISELLELVYKKDLRGEATLWYAPIETFFRLREIEKYYNTIFSDVKYIPSQQQKIYAFYNMFNKKQKKIINDLIEKKINLKLLEYSLLKDKEKIKILDFLLEYLMYKSINTDDFKDNNFKQSVLLKRLSFPRYAYVKKEPIDKQDITLYDKPTFISLGYSKSNLLLGYAPFSLNEVGYNQYNGDILNILSGTIAVNKNKISLHHLDIMKIRRLKTQKIPFDIANPYSWSIQIGIDNRTDIDYFVDAGIGFSWQISSYINVYSMLHASVHSNNNHYRVNPNIGVFINLDKFRFNADYGYENMEYKNIFSEKFSIKSQYKFHKDFSIFINMQKRESTYMEFGIKWFL